MTFIEEVKGFIPRIKEVISLNDEWTIRGFTDVLGNVYPIGSDTKLISKILENQIFPLMEVFARERGYKLELPKHQNYYPDMTIIDEECKNAVDIKTTYRKSEDRCNGFTLGSYGAYFKDRTSTKNIQYPYGEYKSHYSLCIIYDRLDVEIEETKTYGSLEEIPPIIGNFTIFITEKWQIASKSKGSGNTKNIGSITSISDMLNGKGVFLEEESFDNYWRNKDE